MQNTYSQKELINIKHGINVKKYYCHICFKYVKHFIKENDFTISYYKYFSGFYFNETRYYEDSNILCSSCFKQHKILNFKYKKNKTLKANTITLLKKFKHISIYNKYFIKHLQIQKIINLELIEYLFYPKILWKWLKSGNNNIENYLN